MVPFILQVFGAVGYGAKKLQHAPSRYKSWSPGSDLGLVEVYMLKTATSFKKVALVMESDHVILLSFSAAARCHVINSTCILLELLSAEREEAPQAIGKAISQETYERPLTTGSWPVHRENVSFQATISKSTKWICVIFITARKVCCLACCSLKVRDYCTSQGLQKV